MFNEIFIQLLILLAVSMFVIAAAKKINQPYSIALVIVGLALGITNVPFLEEAEHFITQSHVFQSLIISLFLPILLGDATLKLPISQLKEQLKPVLALALGGTLLTFIVIALSGYFILGWPIAFAFTFAALMSATDPISVISIFKQLGVPKSIVTIIEGESLFNDGIAVVLFQISSVYLLSYLEMGWSGFGSGILLFLKFVLGGMAIGAILGYIFSQIIRFYDDYPLEIGFSMLLFFGCFFIAEHFHVSGVIAVVVSGLIFGSYGAKIGMSETTKLNINTFWEVVTLIANSLVFLMIGLEINHIDFSDKWMTIAGAIGIVLAGRTIALFISLSGLRQFPRSWNAVLNWGGLKGSLSIALALSLPPSFEGRDDILVFTFSVVLFSLLVQGLTIKPLVMKLGLSQTKEDRV